MNPSLPAKGLGEAEERCKFPHWGSAFCVLGCPLLLWKIIFLPYFLRRSTRGPQELAGPGSLNRLNPWFLRYCM